MADGDDAAGALALVPLDVARAHLREPDPDDNPLIGTYIAAAVGTLDSRKGWFGRALVPQTIVRRFDAGQAHRLAFPPLIAVSGVDSLSGTTWTPLDPASYWVDQWDEDEQYLRPVSSWPSSHGLRVTYRAGYDGLEGRVLPPALRAALLLMVGDLYRFRETVSIATQILSVPMSTTVTGLLDPLRVWF